MWIFGGIFSILSLYKNNVFKKNTLTMHFFDKLGNIDQYVRNNLITSSERRYIKCLLFIRQMTETLINSGS